MKHVYVRQYAALTLLRLLLIGTGVSLVGFGQAQNAGTEKKEHPWTYSQNAPEFSVSLASMPADVQPGYRLFRSKCGECHSLNRLLTKTDLSADEWGDIVYRMQDMASSHTSEAQSRIILKFVEWNDKNRKEQRSKDAAPPTPKTEERSK